MFLQTITQKNSGLGSTGLAARRLAFVRQRTQTHAVSTGLQVTDRGSYQGSRFVGTC